METKVSNKQAFYTKRLRVCRLKEWKVQRSNK